MILTIFLVLTGFLALVLLWSGRSRKINEPPLDKGLLPWLGHALEFGKDASKFLTRMKNKHGDIFTVRVAGHYVTVLLDPNSYDAVLHDTVSLDFTCYRNVLMEKIFSLQLPNSYHVNERAWMKQQFHGQSLAKLRFSMGTHLKNLLASDQRACSPAEWRQEGLFDLCYSLLFRAGYLSMFDKENDADTVYKQFRKFDNLLPKLARRTLKKEERKLATLSQEKLWELLSIREDFESSSWQQCYQLYLQEEGVDSDTQRKALLLQLWTTQGNAGPAAFWLLGFLLSHPEAMRALKAEIKDVMRDGCLQQSPLDRLDTHNTPVFDSVLSETLRLTAAAMVNREVVLGKVLQVSSGQVYHLRRGDRVCLFPFLSPQMDPQIHHEPKSFKYDRFLNDDMTEKKTFYKGGERLKYYSMPWGAGNNSCVGKLFAISSIKLFVFMVLTHLELEMCDPKGMLPPVNPARYGFGMLQPAGELQVRYRLKQN